jgi:lipopolysaccharide transport system permease protein
MTRHSINPIVCLSSAWLHRGLIFQLAKRDVLSRYRGSMLGIVWPLLHPMVMLAIYTFIFSVVFRARWSAEGQETGLEFATILFCGMIVFGIFAEYVARAPQLVVAQPNFVKKVVFPLEILPWVPLLSALFHAALNALVLIVLLVATRTLHPTILWSPLVLLPYVMLCLGMGLFLAAFGVFVRDVAHIMGVVITALMFLSPLFYPASAIPEPLRTILNGNPLVFPIEQVRGLVIWGRHPDWPGLLVYSTISAGVLALGFALFQRARSRFADVL